jgi:hypothetical protein
MSLVSRRSPRSGIVEAYCGRDTEGMLWLVEALANLVNRP